MAKKNKYLKKADTASIALSYVDLLNELKEEIRAAQLKASLAVNSELVFLYWEIGKKLSARMANEGWGAKVIDRLAHDLGVDFPGVSGFSPRNLRYMRKFAESYDDPSILQALLAKIPWWHNILLLEKLETHEERVWYAAPGAIALTRMPYSASSNAVLSVNILSAALAVECATRLG